jgi:hypothetical protein
MTTPEEPEPPAEVMEFGGSLRPFGDDAEPPSRETRVSFARRGWTDTTPRSPGRIWTLLARLDRDRRVLVAGALLTAAALVAAVAGWALNGSPEQPSFHLAEATVDTHGLSQSQAACERFSTIERIVETSAIERYNVGLPPDPAVMRRSVRSFDAIAGEFPAADYRLIAAFSAVSDHTMRLLHGAPGADPDANTAGFTALGAARRACIDVAAYDTSSSIIINAGHPPPSAAAQARVDARYDDPNTGISTAR